MKKLPKPVIIALLVGVSFWAVLLLLSVLWSNPYPVPKADFSYSKSKGPLESKPVKTPVTRSGRKFN